MLILIKFKVLKKTIIRYLLLKIQAGEIHINEKMPSENQLKIKFNCNRHTASSALKELTKKKLLEYKKGVGHFLMQTFEQISSINAYAPYSQVKHRPFILEQFPIRLLANFSFSNYKPTLVSDFYIDGTHNATQYLFLSNDTASKISNNFEHNNLFKLFVYYGIVILNLNKQVSFINNDKAYLSINDDFIMVLKFVFSDENNREVATLYNLLSSKWFMAKKGNISI